MDQCFHAHRLSYFLRTHRDICRTDDPLCAGHELLVSCDYDQLCRVTTLTAPAITIP